MNENNSYWQKRLSRRKVLRGAALSGAGLAAAAVVGCGDDDEEGPASAAPTATAAGTPAGSPAASGTPAAVQPKTGGLLRKWFNPPAVFYGFEMDPHPAQPVVAGSLTMMYSPLIRFNPKTLSVEQNLAQKFEVVSPTEVVFTLTPGVKFHNKPPVNGREMTAQDVVFSLQRIGTNDPRFQNRLNFDTVERFEAVDNKTVKFVMKTPNAAILSSAAAFSAGIMAPEAVEKFGKFATAETVIGTGPMIIKSREDTVAEFERNPDFWKKGMPYLDGVRLQAMDAQSGFAALLAGQLDVTWPVGDLKKIEAEQGKDYKAEKFTDVSLAMAMPNVQKAPFSDPRVYKALRLMVDHHEAATGWADVFFGSSYLSAVLPPGLQAQGWDWKQEEYEKNFLEWKKPKDDAVKEAVSLLSAAGFTKDKPLKFTLHAITPQPFAIRMGEMLQDQWRRFGQGAVETEIQLLELGPLNAVRAQGNFEYFISNIGPSIDFEPDSWFRTMHRTGGGRNYGRNSDATLDGMIDKAREKFNQDERKAASKEITKYIAENSPYTTWAGFNNLNLYRPNVQNHFPESFTAIFGFQTEQNWLS